MNDGGGGSENRSVVGPGRLLEQPQPNIFSMKRHSDQGGLLAPPRHDELPLLQGKLTE